MGRSRTIDRNALLDAAEDIVRTQGAAALTIDAVAKAAGVTKGGVQYSFSTKTALIDALFDRWGESYTKLFATMAGPDASPLTMVRAHVEATRSSDDVSNAKAASLLASLLQTPQYLSSTQDWYHARLDRLDPEKTEDRRARVAFLATEGAFMLRFFGLLDMTEAEWNAFFADIVNVLDPPEAPKGIPAPKD